MEYVKIGKIINTFGIKGELKVESLTDFVSDRYSKDSLVYIGDEKIPFVMNGYRIHKGFLLISFNNKEDINLVEKYKNMYIYKDKNDIRPLNEGEYYYSDLKDLDVYIDNKCIGKVLYVEEGISCNYLRVKLDYESKLIPFLPVFIDNVDLTNKRINVKKVDGLV